MDGNMAQSRLQRRSNAITPEVQSADNSQSPSDAFQPTTIPVTILFSAGILGMLAVLILASAIGEPKPMQALSMIVLLAFSAACALAGFMGSMEITSGAVRTGGAAAVFVFVCAISMAFLDPDHFGNLVTMLGGKSTAGLRH
jgi:hypothetical protein